MRHPKLIAFLALSLIAATGAFASRTLIAPPLAAKIHPFVLKALETNGVVPVIVKLKKQADLKSIVAARLPLAQRQKAVYDALRTTAMNDQADLVKLLDTRAVKYRRFYISNMIAVFDASADLVKEIAARSDVEKVFANPSVALKMPSPAVRFSQGLAKMNEPNGVGDNIAFMKADAVWAQYHKQGEGIVVAGQDTGVQFDHPALAHQYRGYDPTKNTASHDYNWHDSIHKDTPIASNRCGYDLDVPCDDGDHGSHTMGTIVGSDGKDNLIGMAPKAQWIACRNMDGGTGTPASYIECFEWLLAPYKSGANPMTDADPAKAPNIVNNSWGCPPEEGCAADEILPSLEAMKAAGVLVVVSAGNDGPDCSTIQDPPAWHSALTLGVGAYDHRSGTIASFSSRGPSKFDNEIGPDLVAPGVNIRSSVPGGQYAQFGWSGTSMAGPHVAGAAALLWSIKPDLIGDIEKTTDILKQSATPKTTSQSCGGVSGSAIPNNTYGMGVIDLEKALQLAGAKAPRTEAPTPPTPPTTPPSKPSKSVWPKRG
ncbi:MAG: S8 family serine peptidase [Bdellovibrionales bacterium]|nr:S8 family serine peptidase [Bdellovibrionales bacterium]